MRTVRMGGKDAGGRGCWWQDTPVVRVVMPLKEEMCVDAGSV